MNRLRIFLPISIFCLCALFHSLTSAQGRKLRLVIEPEKLAFYSLDGRDSLILTPYNTVADSTGALLDTTLVISPAGMLVGGGWQPALSIESLTVNVSFNETAPIDRKSTRLNSSHIQKSRMPSSA